MPTADVRLLDPFGETPFDWTFKGLPASAEGLTGDQLGSRGLRLFGGDVIFPIATLRDDVMRSNSDWMMRFLGRLGADLAPHGKTTMSPDLMRLQLQNGAWGLTAATVHHVRAYRAWGAERVILANQLAGAGEIDWIARELQADPGFDFYCLVDSVEGATHLAARLAETGLTRPLNVLLEVGTTGGRTGVRGFEAGAALAQAVAALPQLALCGVETFEGLFLTQPDSVERSAAMLRTVVDLARHCDRAGLFSPGAVILTGGGSALFDVAAEILSGAGLSRPVRVVIRSGCYLVHDDGMYRALFDQVKARIGPAPELEGGLKSALHVWARVLSKPEPGRMICGLGKRDIGSDYEMPRLVGWVSDGASAPLPVPTDCRLTALNDQHAYVDGPCEPYAIGDLIGFGISHPCTTFDKWRALFTIDPDFRITGAVRTYF